MSEVIKVSEMAHRLGALHIFILNCVGDDTPGFTEALKRARENDNNFTIEFKINGVEFPFTRTVVEMFRRYDEDVESSAAKLMTNKLPSLAQKLNGIEEAICRAQFEVTNAVREAFPKAYIPDDD